MAETSKTNRGIFMFVIKGYLYMILATFCVGVLMLIKYRRLTLKNLLRVAVISAVWVLLLADGLDYVIDKEDN